MNADPTRHGPSPEIAALIESFMPWGNGLRS